MKFPSLPFLAALLPLVCAGCAVSSPVGRYAGDVAATGAGFVAGDRLSNGNKAVAVGSGAVALGLTRLVENKSDQRRMAELDEAYRRGMAQDAKVSYLAIQNSQALGRKDSPTDGDAEPQLTPIPIAAPARTVNGVRLNPTVETVYITTK